MARDSNQVPVIQGVLNTDGDTPTDITIDPSTHILDTANGPTGSDFGNDLASRNDNYIPTMIATDANGNIIPLYVDSSGKLLTNSM